MSALPRLCRHGLPARDCPDCPPTVTPPSNPGVSSQRPPLEPLREWWRNRRAAKSDLRAVVTAGPDDLLVVQVDPRLGEEALTAMAEAFVAGAPHMAGRAVFVVADSVTVVRGGAPREVQR